MDRLNLPEINPMLKKEQGKAWIFDIIRKKYVALTAEEWVRQHFIHYLINEMKYPKSLFRIEKSLTYNTLQKRSDIAIYDRMGNPWMLIECKSSTIKLTQRAFNQTTIYNMTIQAKYITVTNGLIHYCWEVPKVDHEIIMMNQFPEFPKN